MVGEDNIKLTVSIGGRTSCKLTRRVACTCADMRPCNDASGRRCVMMAAKGVWGSPARIRMAGRKELRRGHAGHFRSSLSHTIVPPGIRTRECSCRRNRSIGKFQLNIHGRSHEVCNAQRFIRSFTGILPPKCCRNARFWVTSLFSPGS